MEIGGVLRNIITEYRLRYQHSLSFSWYASILIKFTLKRTYLGCVAYPKAYGICSIEAQLQFNSSLGVVSPTAQG